MTLSELEKELKTVTPNVFHLDADTSKVSMPYIVYSEYRERFFYSDNKPGAGTWRVQIDYFTKQRKDQNATVIKELLAAHEIPFSHSKLYDKDNKAVRHIFDCEGVEDG